MITTAVMSKYVIPALFGAATKTYFDFKRQKVSLCKLISNLILNSIFAAGFGSMVAHTFAQEFPTKDHLVFVVAYFAGAVGINILAGLLAINWESIITSRLGGHK